MRKSTSFRSLIAVLALVSIVAAGCAGDDDGGGGQEGDATGKGGGSVIDGGTFVGDPPEHIDPALNTTLDAYQLINAVFDGLTEVDTSDKDNPVTKPLVAESFEPNADATVWTFKIRKDAVFADGEKILPSTFQKSWERATVPDFAGDYSYLFNFIDGGKEKLDGKAQTISGVKANDETGELVVTLDKPYANFATVAGFQIFNAVHSSALAKPADYENGVMIGNGPYTLAAPRSDTEIKLKKNDKWVGDINGKKWEDRLDEITFRVTADPDTAYASLEAGEVDTANVPPGRVKEAQKNYGTTTDVAVLGVYYYVFNSKDPVVGGAKNKLLRQAISQAIDRETINEQVYDGTRTLPSGITPPGIPGFKDDICKFCKYDLAAAKKAFADWQAAGNKLSGPIALQFNADAGHEDVVAIIVDNLKAVGITAEPKPFPSETYFSSLAKGACQFCRSGWYADYPTYDNFMYDLFHTDAIGGNNNGLYSNPKFDKLVDEAKATTDEDTATKNYNEAEELLLNEDIAAVPVNFYLGDYVWNNSKLANFPQTPLGLIAWEQIRLKG